MEINHLEKQNNICEMPNNVFSFFYFRLNGHLFEFYVETIADSMLRIATSFVSI